MRKKRRKMMKKTKTKMKMKIMNKLPLNRLRISTKCPNRRDQRLLSKSRVSYLSKVAVIVLL